MEQKLDDFLKEYKELADSNGLSSQQKVETIIWYVAVPHCNFWMAAEGYATHDWDDFCQALRKTYMDISTWGRYTQDKLRDFVWESCKHRRREEEDILQYYRQFQVLSKPLLDANRLTM
jgi:predicted Fe-S protein YdhL (DUF1289 family)